MPFRIHLLMEHTDDSDPFIRSNKEDEVSSDGVLQISVTDADRATLLLALRQILTSVADAVRVPVSLIGIPRLGGIVPDAIDI